MYNRVIEIANKWKNECDKIQDFREEDNVHTDALITYFVNLLNANNIRYNIDLA